MIIKSLSGSSLKAAGGSEARQPWCCLVFPVQCSSLVRILPGFVQQLQPVTGMSEAKAKPFSPLTAGDSPILHAGSGERLLAFLLSAVGKRLSATPSAPCSVLRVLAVLYC
jgi:hypothetical protein